MATPRGASRRTISMSRRTSASASAAVGSSMIISRAFWESARGDLHPLAVGDRQRADFRIDIELGAVERIEQRSALLAHCRPIQRRPSRLGRLAEKDIFGDRQFGKQQQFLMNGGDARSMGLARRCKSDRRAVDADLAFVGLVQARHDLDQRRLAGAVLAEQRMHFAGADIEAYVLERVEPGEDFDMRDSLMKGAVIARTGSIARRKTITRPGLRRLSTMSNPQRLASVRAAKSGVEPRPRLSNTFSLSAGFVDPKLSAIDYRLRQSDPPRRFALLDWIKRG